MIDIAVCKQKLCQGLMAMDVILDDQKISLLLHYLSEFVKWNKAYNLSAVRDPLKMVERHLLDSLALVPLLEKAHDKQRIIDVGTGGGLPGIPLAIVFTDSQITLLDSNGKKTRFLFQVKMALDLNNLTIANTRVETYQPDEGFDIVVSRAFASLQYMVKGTGHLLNQHGRFWAMKGVYPENELRDCEKNAIVESSKSLNIPEQQGERHLLILKPVTSEAVINWDKPEL